MRTTRKELDALARLISDATLEPYEIGYAYGRPRLERAGGSVEVSPRLPAGELAEWMRAFIAGIHAERRSHPVPPLHTIGHEPISKDNPGAYGRTHDMDCPGCAGTPFTLSPRSETYWSS